MHLDPFRMDYTLGCCILYEWLKYELRDDVIMSTLLVDLPFCICGCKDVLEFIIGQDGPVLLNVDEAQNISSKVLFDIVTILGECLLHGVEVYFTISGLYDLDIKSIILSAGRAVEIYIPPLDMNSCAEIVSEFMSPTVTLTADMVLLNPFMRHLLWLCGGIPRYVSFLLFSIAEQFQMLSTDGHLLRESLSQYCVALGSMSACQCTEIVSRLKAHCFRGDSYIRTFTPEIKDNIVALCVTGERISSNVKLCDKPCWAYRSSTLSNEDQRSVVIQYSESACTVGLAYMNAAEQMVVPPIQLHRICDESCSISKISILRHLHLVQGSRDDESTYATIMSYRLKVSKLKGTTNVSLSYLLGVEVPHSLQNVMLKVCESEVRVAERTVLSSDYQSLQVGVFTVNCPTASCTDMNCMLELENGGRFLLCVQLKLRTAKNYRTLTTESTSKTLHKSDVIKEYQKILVNGQPPNNGNVVFVYMTDEDAAAGEVFDFEDHQIVVVPQSKREEALGVFVNQLQKYAVSLSYADLKDLSLLSKEFAGLTSKRKFVVSTTYSNKNKKYHAEDSKCVDANHSSLVFESELGNTPPCGRCFPNKK